MTNAGSHFVHYIESLETTQMYLRRRMDKQTI